MSTTNDKFVLFGGGGEYLKRLESRETYSDIWIYYVNSNMWYNPEQKQSVKSEYEPKPRMNHAAGIMNDDLLVIYGGVNRETKQFLDSFVLYDLEKMSWEKPVITYTNPEEKPGSLGMHTIDSYYPYIKLSRLETTVFNQRKKEFDPSYFGLYMFGGK